MLGHLRTTSKGVPHTDLLKVLTTSAAKMVALCFGMISTVISARTLAPQGRGIYLLIVTFLTTATVLGHLSIEHAQVTLWSDQGRRPAIAANTMLLGVANGCLAAAGAIVVIYLLGDALVSASARTILSLALISIPANTTKLYLNRVLYLQGRINWVNTGLLVSSLIQCGATIALAATHNFSVTTAVVVWAIGFVWIPLFIALVGVAPRVRDISVSLGLRTLWLGLRYHPGVSSMFLLFRVDVFLLNSRVSKYDLGLYGLAVTLAELTYLLTDSIAFVVLPSQVGAATLQESAHYTAKILRLNFLTALLMFGAILILGPFAIPFFFGKDFQGAVPALLALAPGVLVFGMNQPVGGFLLRLNRPQMFTMINCSAMIINIGLNLLLIPRYGIVGSSLASTVTYMLLVVGNLFWFCRAGGVQPSQLIPRRSEIRRELANALNHVTNRGRHGLIEEIGAPTEAAFMGDAAGGRRR